MKAAFAGLTALVVARIAGYTVGYLISLVLLIALRLV